MDADMSPEMALQVLDMLTGGGSMDSINTSLALRLIPLAQELENDALVERLLDHATSVASTDEARLGSLRGAESHGRHAGRLPPDWQRNPNTLKTGRPSMPPFTTTWPCSTWPKVSWKRHEPPHNMHCDFDRPWTTRLAFRLAWRS